MPIYAEVAPAPGGLPELRCPQCRKMMATRGPDGSYEIRLRGRLVAVVRSGEIGCGGCETVVSVEIKATRRVGDVFQVTVPLR